MNNINIIGLTLHAMDNGCNQINSVTGKEFDNLAEEYIDSPVLEIGQSEKLTAKLSLLSEINYKISEAQEIIKTCRTLSKVLNGMTGI